MLNKILRVKYLIIEAFAVILAVAAFFNFRCPAEGCPACKLLGK